MNKPLSRRGPSRFRVGSPGASVSCRLRPRQGQEPSAAFVGVPLDIGRGGARIVGALPGATLYELLSLGNEVFDLEFRIPALTPLRTGAVLRWAKSLPRGQRASGASHVFGVSFPEITRDGQDELERALKAAGQLGPQESRA